MGEVSPGAPSRPAGPGFVFRLFSALFSNFALKVLSVLLAIALWVVVAEDQVFEETAQVALDVRRPAHLMSLENLPKTISVKLLAPRSKLKQLRTRPLQLVLDASAATAGDMVVNLAGQRIRNLPAGVEVTAWNPASLKLEFDERLQRTLPVRVQLEGEVPDGYKLVKTEALQARIELEGPAGDLARLREVVTEPLKVDAMTSSRKVTLPLMFSSPHVREKAGREDVDVQVTIVPITGRRLFDDLMVQLPETLSRFKAVPARVEVTLEGPQVTLDAIEPADVQVSVTLPTEPLANRDRFELRMKDQDPDAPQLKVTFPEGDGVVVKRLVPSRIELKALRSGSKRQTSP